jgi:type VI secretion system protein ImpL
MQSEVVFGHRQCRFKLRLLALGASSCISLVSQAQAAPTTPAPAAIVLADRSAASASASHIGPARHSAALGLRGLALSDKLSLDAAVVRPTSTAEPSAWRPFKCKPGMALWQARELGEALALLREHQKQAASHGTPHASKAARSRLVLDRATPTLLEHQLQDLLRRAQRREAAQAVGMIPGHAVEDRLKRASSHMVRVQGTLAEVLWLARQLGMNNMAAAVTACSRTHAQSALEQVNMLAELNRLWIPAMKQGLGERLDIGDRPAVDEYLRSQRARTEMLVDYAGPFVSFLRHTPSVSESNATVDAIAAFWANTADELKRRNQFRDGQGSVSQLERLIQRHADDLGTESCTTRLADVSAFDAGNNLFVLRGRRLSEVLRLRCEHWVFAGYLEFQRRFNNTLAGRFPFGGLDSADAGPRNVRDLLAADVDQFNTLKSDLTALNIERAEAPLRFVRQWNAARDVLRGVWRPDGGGQPISVSLKAIKVAETSPGGEAMESWVLNAGSQRVVYPSNSPLTLDWAPGQSLSLTLNLDRRSDWRPVSDPSSPNGPTVDGAKAEFYFAGDWALFRLIEQHRSRLNAAGDAVNQHDVVLAFVVPLVSKRVAGNEASSAKREARLYMTLRLEGLDPETQQPVELRWPEVWSRVAPEVPLRRTSGPSIR